MNVYLMNTTEIGFNILGLLQDYVPIKGMIGLTDREPSEAISGYASCQARCNEIGIPFIGVKSYTLSASEDEELLSSLDVDILIVAGWQRLIPDWLIKNVKEHALGFHGSPWGITRGRGRSPQNWALILGEEKFSLSLFQIAPGVDDGDIFQTKDFRYEVTDDIKSSHFKVSLLSAEMLKEHFKQLKCRELQAYPQQGESYYLPQRKPEDGFIDWRCTSISICNLVRGLTRPYPGARTTLSGMVVTIWKANPITLELDTSLQPGQILTIFSSGEFVVRTGDGMVLVEEYSCEQLLRPFSGEIFESVDIYEQYRVIADRHIVKYPDLPLAPQVLAHAANVRC